MSSVTVYGRHSPDFFFSDAYSVFVCKVHYLLVLFLRIAYCGISSSAFMLYTAYHKVCSVDHTAVAYLDSRLWVSFGRFGTHLDFIIIVKVLLFVVTVLCFHIRQDKCEVGIAVPITSDSSLNGSRSKQVKFSVPSNQEVNILLLRYQIMQEPVKAVTDLRSALDVPKGDDCLYFLPAVAKLLRMTEGTLRHRPLDIQLAVCKRYVDNWYCDTFTIQHELRDAMMLITKPEMTDSEKDKAVGKD